MTNEKTNEKTIDAFSKCSVLDITKLKNVHYVDGKLWSQCPACVEQGQDLKGMNHLVIYKTGKFGCIRFTHDNNDGNPPEYVKEHRSRIFKLVGEENTKNLTTHNVKKKPFFINSAVWEKSIIINRNVDKLILTLDTSSYD